MLDLLEDDDDVQRSLPQCLSSEKDGMNIERLEEYSEL